MFFTGYLVSLLPTIPGRFMSPTAQGEIRTEAVQPDALKAGTKINQQLGYGGHQDPQKVSSNTYLYLLFPVLTHLTTTIVRCKTRGGCNGCKTTLLKEKNYSMFKVCKPIQYEVLA